MGALDKIYNSNLQKSFDKLQSKAQIDAVIQYCNSLWKWKLSNLDAKWYAKNQKDKTAANRN